MPKTRGNYTCKKFIGLLVITVCLGLYSDLFSQTSLHDSLRVKVFPLSKLNTKDAEYSPFKYQNKFYFVSDRENDFGIVYFDKKSARQFSDLYRAYMTDTMKFKSPTPISEQLKTKFYIGPSCETESGFYCTVNNAGLLKSKKQLPLQISFLQKDKKGKFKNPTRISFGISDTISCAQPSVWADTLMFFSSNLYAATGKIDLFYSIKKDGEWQKPVNCGTRVNTEYNEVFPFYMNGILYFSSDRPNGFGGLDVYRIDFFNPDARVELLSNPLNTRYDDFGVYIDSTQQSGYFSSNRTGNDDIYFFKTVLPFFDNCNEVKSNNYCFTFYEETSMDEKDTTGYSYEWSFGDGGKKRGLEVRHCYKGEGTYLVELNVVDKTSGVVFFNEVSYEFELKNIIQIYIHAPDTAPPGYEVSFDPGYTNIDSLLIEKYFWDFGDGSFSFDDKPLHVYSKTGEYMVTLGVEGIKNGEKYKQCASKKIVITNEVKEPIYRFQPPVKHVPPIDYVKMIRDSIEKNEPDFAEFIKKKEKMDSIAGTKTFLIPEIIKGNESDVGLNPKPEKDDPTKKINNVFVFNEKDSTITYKVHIGVATEKIEPNDPVFKGMSPITYEEKDGVFHYFYGVKKSLKEIVPYLDTAKKEGFKSSIVSAFQKDLMLDNQNLRHQFQMFKDTLKSLPESERKDRITISKTPTVAAVAATNVKPQKLPKEYEPPIKTTKTVKESNQNSNVDENELAQSSAPSGYRVEIMSSRFRKPPESFQNMGKVMEVKTKDGYYKYYTEDVKSEENAKDLKEVLIFMGYTQASIPGENKKTPAGKYQVPNSANFDYSSKIAYRVQVGAYKSQKSLTEFGKLSAYIKEIKADDGYFKYVSEDVKTLENALDLQNALLSMGYRNSFVTAYRGEKRISIIESVLDGLSVFFNLDSYKVLPAELEKIDYYFKNYSNKFIKEIALEGNTCNLGTSEYNFGLSQRRVLAVEEALQPYVKVKVNRKFLGEFYPLYSNSSEASRKLNRRVDVVIIN